MSHPNDRLDRVMAQKIDEEKARKDDREYRVTRNNKSWRVQLRYGEGIASTVGYQPINAKTGLPWQAHRQCQYFDTPEKAMVAWLKATSAKEDKKS